MELRETQAKESTPKTTKPLSELAAVEKALQTDRQQKGSIMKSFWKKLFGRSKQTSSAGSNTKSGGGSKPTDEQRLLEVGIRALKKSIVVAEMWSKNKAALEDLVADEVKLTAHLAASEAAGNISADNCLNAMRAFRRGDYKIVTSSKGGFDLLFLGMPDHGEEEILAEIKDQMDLCMASQALTQATTGGQGRFHTEEQFNEFMRQNIEMVAKRVMPKYGLGEEEFADLYVKAANSVKKRQKR